MSSLNASENTGKAPEIFNKTREQGTANPEWLSLFDQIESDNPY